MSPRTWEDGGHTALGPKVTVSQKFVTGELELLLGFSTSCCPMFQADHGMLASWDGRWGVTGASCDTSILETPGTVNSYGPQSLACNLLECVETSEH